MEEISQSMIKALEMYKLSDDGLEKAPKGKIRQTQKLNKKILLERYNGADEKLAGKVAWNKQRINEQIDELSRDRELKEPTYFFLFRFNCFLQLTTIFEYQMKLLELQSKVEK
jgi:hypothetical protein